MSEPQPIERLSDLERALDHGDDRVRLQVVQLIAQHPQQALALATAERDVIDALDERIEREPPSGVRVAMLLALTSIGADERITKRMVREAQRSHSTYEQMLSLGYLAQHDAANARPFARRLLFSGKRDQVRIAAKLLGADRDLTPRERVRVHALEREPLARAWRGAHLEALIDELAGDFHLAARALILEHHPDAFAPLVERWNELDHDTRAWLVDEAAGLSDGATAETIVRQALLSADVALLERGVQAVGRSPTLAAGIERTLVLAGLERAPHLLPSVLRAYPDAFDLEDVAIDSDRSTDVRVSALRVLASLRPDQVTDVTLRACLEDGDWRVRSAAAELLAHRSDLPAWLAGGWPEMSEAARVALARAALEQHHERLLEPQLAGAFT